MGLRGSPIKYFHVYYRTLEPYISHTATRCNMLSHNLFYRTRCTHVYMYIVWICMFTHTSQGITRQNLPHVTLIPKTNPILLRTRPTQENTSTTNMCFHSLPHRQGRVRRCMCMCVCVCVCVCVSVSVSVYVCMWCCVWCRVCMWVGVYIRAGHTVGGSAIICACVRACVCVCVCMCVCAPKRACVHVSVYASVYAWVFMSILIHIYVNVCVYIRIYVIFVVHLNSNTPDKIRMSKLDLFWFVLQSRNTF